MAIPQTQTGFFNNDFNVVGAKKEADNMYNSKEGEAISQEPHSLIEEIKSQEEEDPKQD